MSCGGFFMWGLMQGCFTSNVNDQNKTTFRSNHTTSVRGNLVKTYKTDIHDDYFLDIDQELGKGGCGVVVIGEHKETRTQYAIKIVDKSHAERGRLDRELKLLKDVDHTNVVRLFTVYDVPSHMYFVMELCLGGHLGNLLARQPRKYLDETWAKQLALQLLSAVAHIHTRGIAHRDIKLQNILVDQNTNDRTAQLKLIDFGYGSRYVGALPMRTKCGTPYTTAPEVIREHYDERCDVWSCGVVLYIMLCGRRPFEALNCAGTLADAGKAAMITNILAGRYHFNHKPWQTVTKQGLQFVKSLLHPDYKQRMRSYEALENPWLIDSNIINEHATILSSQKSFKAAHQIRRMSEVTELQRTGMVALVFGINTKTVADMSTVFQSFDTDSSGMLSKDEFSTAMSKIVPELTQLDLEKLFNIIDYDKNQSISYTEFLAATLDPRELDIGELNKAFKLFDEDGNGYISKDEMRKVIRMQCEQAFANNILPNQSSPHALDIDTLTAEVNAKVELIFSEADVNNDGAISHAEFLWVMTGLDFHKLDQLGFPIDGGVSAKDTFMHNLQRRSCDSAEDWNEEIDHPFDIQSSYSLRSYITGTTGTQYAPLSPQGSSWNNNNNNNTTTNNNQYQATAMAGYGSRDIGNTWSRDTGNSQKLKKQPSPQRSNSKGMPLISTSSYKQLETYEEKNVECSSSSSYVPIVETSPTAGVAGGTAAVVDEGKERPSQRHSRRLRDEPVVERQNTPVMLILGKPSTLYLGGDDEAVNPGSAVGTPVKAGSVNKNLAFYEEPGLPILTGRKSSEEDVEMAEITQYGTKVIVNSNPSTPGQMHARGISKTFSQKQLSVKFDSVSLYNTDNENIDYLAEERSGRLVATRSAKDLPGLLSRGTSYRESTIIDGASGKDTIRVIVEKPYSSSAGGGKEEEAHMLTARQNSGNVALPASAVEPPPPIESPAPFLSTRGFSLSNMLRSNDPSMQTGINNDKETSARITNTTTNTTTTGAGLSEAIAPGTGSSKNIIPLIRTTSFSRGSSMKTSSKR